MSKPEIGSESWTFMATVNCPPTAPPNTVGLEGHEFESNVAMHTSLVGEALAITGKEVRNAAELRNDKTRRTTRDFFILLLPSPRAQLSIVWLIKEPEYRSRNLEIKGCHA